MRCRSASVAFLTCICLLEGSPRSSGIAPEMQTALDAIQASDLRNDLKFIASDELQGRDTPSPGLDRAADYIAEQFRRAGLEPGAGNSYFQTASMILEQPDFSHFELKLVSGNQQFEARSAETFFYQPFDLDLTDSPIFKLELDDDAQVRHLTKAQVQGKVVVAAIDRPLMRRLEAAEPILRSGAPALVIFVDRKGDTTRYRRNRRLIDPSAPPETNRRQARIYLSGDRAANFLDALKPGANNATAAIHLAALRTPVMPRNVIGVLRGSDPALRDTAVLLTAHYDHLGMKPDGPGDRIYNGANDDGSGTVSVIEVARALARLPHHPRRSIVFMTFFGEEEGLIGSEYYVHHPIWPLAKTEADLNLEQLGRTDSSEGREVANATLTGFDYSELTRFVQDAGKSTGIKVYKDRNNSDPYFPDSDNFSLAEAGVPAETLAVAFEFPDYHAVGDEWQKIDYDNMAKVDRAVALATFLLADSARPVRWNESNPNTAPYVKVWEKRETK
jgi:hypothetical protein